MMPGYAHFIITLFNLRLWNVDKKKVPTHTESWLDSRFDMFGKQCFPSVAAQTNKNFVWICLFDKGTPGKYLEKIQEYQERLPQFSPHYLDLEETADIAATIDKIIKSYLSAEEEYIITTNLDNDDAIHSGMVARLQSAIGKDSCGKLYSFNLGYQYFTHLGIILKMKYPHNHFLTVVEARGPEYRTVLTYHHARARKALDSVDILEQPYWVEFVHGNNVNNDLRITSRVSYRAVTTAVDLRPFGLDIVISRREAWYGTFVRLPFKWLGRACNRITRKIRKAVCRNNVRESHAAPVTVVAKNQGHAGEK